MEEEVAELERLAEADQRAALDAGTSLVPLADPALEVRARRSLGNANRNLSRLGAAFEHYAIGIRVARRHGLTAAEGLVRLSRAGAYSMAGDRRRALADLQRAEQLTTGHERAIVLFQRAVVVQRFSEGADAIEILDEVIPLLRRYDDQVILAHALSNRGLARIYQGQPAAAERDLRAALESYERLDMPSPAAVVVHNLGLVRIRMLDLPGALGHFDEAEARLQALGRPSIGLQVDRAEALLSAGLVDDALALGRSTVRELRRRRLMTDLAEALLVCAQSAAVLGDDDAEDLARAAAETFARQARPGWRDRALLLQLELVTGSGRATAADERRARRLAERLAANDLRGPAARAAMIEGWAALDRGGIRAAEGAIDRAAGARRSGLIEERLAYWDLLAAHRLVTDRRGAAMAAVRAGLRDLATFRDRVAAPDARAGTAIHAGRLFASGLRAASGSPSPRVLLEWIERTAEAYVQLDTAAEEGDLTALLDELRGVSALLTEAGDTERRALVATRQRLETAVARRSRRRAGPGRSDTAASPRAALADAAGKRILAFVDLDGTTVCCERAPNGTVRRRALNPSDDTARRVRSLLGLHRRLAARPDPRLLTRLDRAASELGELLVPDDVPDGDEVLIVPRGILALVPWMSLPRLDGARCSVSFSVAAWARAEAVPADGDGPLTVIVGPRLDRAAEEATAIAAAVDRVEVVQAGSATVGRVIEALRGSSTVHFACHGEFRTDNPLLSSLEMADGPLTVYDVLERTGPIAPEVVLSSCSGAEVSDRPERAFVGLGGGLLTAGIRSLVASVAPVRDEAATTRLMVEYHCGRRAGATPAEALAAGRRSLADPIERTLAGAFLTLGA